MKDTERNVRDSGRGVPSQSGHAVEIGVVTGEVREPLLAQGRSQLRILVAQQIGIAFEAGQTLGHFSHLARLSYLLEVALHGQIRRFVTFTIFRQHSVGYLSRKHLSSKFLKRTGQRRAGLVCLDGWEVDLELGESSVDVRVHYQLPYHDSMRLRLSW